jgi:hypothetical protein
LVAYGVLLMERQWLAQSGAIRCVWVGVAILSLWIPARLHDFYRNTVSPSDRQKRVISKASMTVPRNAP